MEPGLTRRRFFGLAPTLAALPSLTFAQEGPAVHSEFPSHDPKLVQEIVGAAHTNFEKVKAMLERSPALANAAWDWGFGDWETPIGAASHVGRHNIVELLLGHGARPDVFTFAMMGDLDTVKAIVGKHPGIVKTHGPHGITLLAHARNGGERAKAVLEYLTGFGGADVGSTNLAISDAEKEMFLGKYSFGSGKEDFLEVTKNSQGVLAIRRGERSSRPLNRVADHGFAPRGTPKVHIQFQVDGGKATSLTVHDPEPMVTATRVSSG